MPEPARVLLLIDGFATNERSGGAALFAIQLARHLDRSAVEPMICGLWRYNTPSERTWLARLQEEGITTTTLLSQSRRIELDLVQASALLWQFLNRVRPDILHSHFERGDLLSLMMRGLHPQHPRLIRTMHADQQWQTRPLLGKLLNLAAYPWIFAHEVAVSERTRQIMDARPVARLRGRRAGLLYNGLSDQFLDQSAQRAASPERPQRPPRFAIIGRLEQEKGLYDFLAACAYVHQQLPAATFWIIGAGSMREELEAHVQASGLQEVVSFLGARGDVSDLLPQVDAVISSSLREAFPTVILEAMAMRVPVITTATAGGRELVLPDKTGLLVPIGDPAALGGAMLRVAQHRDEAQMMAQHAHQHIQPYTMRQTAAGYASLYRATLKS